MEEIFTQLINSIVDGEPEATVALTQQALNENIEPLVIIEKALVPGMQIVGEKFSCGEYFLPNLIISANGMQQAMKLLEPALKARQETVKAAGTAVIGTVHGDIHEIGKSLVATMLAVNGFQVFDLGVDVPVDTFISKVKDTGANLLCLLHF
jgi:methanogenic corrinoid protein MtbC1